MTDRIDRTERLLNLVICLMASTVAVSRAQIRDQIPGYAETASPSAFERMFERDKDELRSMGIPVETVSDASGEVLGYRIPQDRYALDGLELTIEERAAVAVAAQVWGQAVVAPVAGTALRKLETTADPESWAPAGLQGSIQLTTTDGALLPLMAALRQERVVTFPYRAPSEESARTRTVSPWGLRSASGHWFLVGYDHDRAAGRTFRLSRIAGAVTVTTHERVQGPPPGFDIAGVGSGEPEDRVTARLRVRPGRAASLRRRAVPVEGSDPWTAEEVTVAAGSVDELVSLACAAGPDAVVVEPDHIAERVRAALSEILVRHRGGAA